MVNIILLILVKFYGYEVKGAVGWISIYGLSLQPSEFIKPFFSVVVGLILSLKFTNDFPNFLVSLFLYLYIMVAILLLIQPEFGMLVIITVWHSIICFAAGMPIFWIMLAIISSAFGVMAAYFLQQQNQ